MTSRSRDESCAEHVAGALLLRGNAGPAPDAIELAKLAGMRPSPDAGVPRAALASDGTLSYAAEARNVDQQRWVARELARWLLNGQALDSPSHALACTAAALLLPRDEFLRDSAVAHWNLRELQLLYPNASLGTLALRITMLHEAVVTYFDHGGVRWRSACPSGLESPTRFERNLAEIARETETILHPSPRVWAFPLTRSVGAVVVCDTKALLSRRD